MMSPSLLPIHLSDLKGIHLICYYRFREKMGKRKVKLDPDLHIEASRTISSRTSDSLSRGLIP